MYNICHVKFTKVCKLGLKVLFDAACVGVWGVGVATQKVNLNQIPLGQDSHSLVLRHDGSVYHNNEEKNCLPANSVPQEGDIVVRIWQFYNSIICLFSGGNVHCTYLKYHSKTQYIHFWQSLMTKFILLLLLIFLIRPAEYLFKCISVYQIINILFSCI